MSVTVSRLTAWRPDLLREAAVQLDVARRLSEGVVGDLSAVHRELPGLWEGQAGTATVAALHTRTAHADHLQEALALVPRILRAAADAVSAAQQSLRQAQATAADQHLVMTDDGTVLPPPPVVLPAEATEVTARALAQHRAAAAAARDAQTQARQALAAATEADADAARALARVWVATSDESGWQAADRALVTAVTARALPADGTAPAEVAAWWASLSTGARALLVAQHDRLGDLDGLPVAVRDVVNRRRLTAALAEAEIAYARAERGHARNGSSGPPGQGWRPTCGWGVPGPSRTCSARSSTSSGSGRTGG